MGDTSPTFEVVLKYRNKTNAEQCVIQLKKLGYITPEVREIKQPEGVIN